MKKNSIILGFAIATLLSVITFSANAQQNRRMNMEEFENKKIEYITKEAELTKEEANKFFPVYNELSKKKFELHRQHRLKMEKMKSSKDNISDEEYRKLLENDVDVKLKEAELDKEYSSKLDDVIAPEKLYKVQQAERKFMQDAIRKFRKSE